MWILRINCIFYRYQPCLVVIILGLLPYAVLLCSVKANALQQRKYSKLYKKMLDRWVFTLWYCQFINCSYCLEQESYLHIGLLISALGQRFYFGVFTGRLTTTDAIVSKRPLLAAVVSQCWKIQTQNTWNGANHLVKMWGVILFLMQKDKWLLCCDGLLRIRFTSNWN